MSLLNCSWQRWHSFSSHTHYWFYLLFRTKKKRVFSFIHQCMFTKFQFKSSAIKWVTLCLHCNITTPQCLQLHGRWIYWTTTNIGASAVSIILSSAPDCMCLCLQRSSVLPGGKLSCCWVCLLGGHLQILKDHSFVQERQNALRRKNREYHSSRCEVLIYHYGSGWLSRSS